MNPVDPATQPPLGPLVDSTPRPLPARVRLRGREVELEPLHVRHAAELFEASQGTDESWAYLGYGPFARMTRWLGRCGRLPPGWCQAGSP